jgi:hypothetical protein
MDSFLPLPALALPFCTNPKHDTAKTGKVISLTANLTASVIKVMFVDYRLAPAIGFEFRNWQGTIVFSTARLFLLWNI